MHNHALVTPKVIGVLKYACLCAAKGIKVSISRARSRPITLYRESVGGIALIKIAPIWTVLGLAAALCLIQWLSHQRARNFCGGVCA